MAANHSIGDVQLFQFKNENETICDRIVHQSSVFVASFYWKKNGFLLSRASRLIGIAAHT